MRPSHPPSFGKSVLFPERLVAIIDLRHLGAIAELVLWLRAGWKNRLAVFLAVFRDVGRKIAGNGPGGQVGPVARLGRTSPSFMNRNPLNEEVLPSGGEIWSNGTKTVLITQTMDRKL